MCSLILYENMFLGIYKHLINIFSTEFDCKVVE
jgi:hypothetical protein